MALNLAVVVLVSLLGLSRSEDDAGGEGDKYTPWSYKYVAGGPMPPDMWANIPNSQCGGQEQSPIDIKTSGWETETVMWQPLEYRGYDRTEGGTFTMSNNGHTLAVQFDDRRDERRVMDGRASMPRMLFGGGLANAYHPLSMHIHFGMSDKEGSEHQIDGRKFPMELHYVHLRADFRGNVTSALDFSQKELDNLAVVGIMVEIGEANPELEQIIKWMEQGAMHKGQKMEIPEFPLDNLMPVDYTTCFARYHGSLTTPMCNEMVVWTVLLKPITVSAEQMDRIRSKMHMTEMGHASPEAIDWNHRPVQPLNDRKIQVHYPIPEAEPEGGDWNWLVGGAATPALSATLVLAATLALIIRLF